MKGILFKYGVVVATLVDTGEVVDFEVCPCIVMNLESISIKTKTVNHTKAGKQNIKVLVRSVMKDHLVVWKVLVQLTYSRDQLLVED